MKFSPGTFRQHQAAPCKATATGKVSHLRGAGSIVSAGELLGTLELKDPSQVGGKDGKDGG